MRGLLVLLVTLLLGGCVISSPQRAQYKEEYGNRQDIRTHTVYRFMTKPVRPSGEEYWGAANLAEFFYVDDKNATRVELRFNYAANTVDVASLDAQNTVLRKRTIVLLDESAAKPADTEDVYLTLTRDGELTKKVRSCKPDMSVGCQWWNHKLFITRSGDLAVQYEKGGTGLIFLLVPAYGSTEYLEIYPKVG